MTDPRDQPPEDLEHFFAPSRSIREEDPARKAALLARLAASIGPPPQGGGESPSLPARAPPATPLATLSWKTGLLAASTFVLGGVAGVTVDRSLREAPRVVFVERPAEQAVGLSSPVLSPASHEAPPPVLLPSATSQPRAPGPPPASPSPNLPSTGAAPDRSTVLPLASAAPGTSATPGTSASAPAPLASASPPGKDAALAEERALLERARTALSRGNMGGALEALQRHATDHPRGRLGEERETLWIHVLMASGRTAEARQRLEQYRRWFPRSFALPALEALVGGR